MSFYTRSLQFSGSRNYSEVSRTHTHRFERYNPGHVGSWSLQCARVRRETHTHTYVQRGKRRNGAGREEYGRGGCRLVVMQDAGDESPSLDHNPAHFISASYSQPAFRRKWKQWDTAVIRYSLALPPAFLCLSRSLARSLSRAHAPLNSHLYYLSDSRRSQGERERELLRFSSCARNSLWTRSCGYEGKGRENATEAF